jgi:membrane-associated HD superfamily phosphohydrolase
LSFESIGFYIKFLFKDIKNSTKKIPEFISNSFGYFSLAILLMVIAMAFVFWFNKISYSLAENLYHYVFLLKLGLFGIVLFFIQKIKKTTTHANIIYLILSITITIVLFWLIKTNLAF